MSFIRKVLRVVAPVVAVGVLSTTASAAGPRVRWVDDDGRAGPDGCRDGSRAARTIAGAVTASSRGDTILVCPGIYRGTVLVSGSRRDDLQIQAVRSRKAIVAPRRASGADLLRISDVTGVRVSGLSFRAETTGDCRRVGTMVRVTGAAGFTELRDIGIGVRGTNTIGRCGYGTGILAEADSNVRVTYSTVRDFTSVGIDIAPSARRASLVHDRVSYRHLKESTGAVAGCGGTGIRVAAGTAESPSVVRNTLVAGVASARSSGAGTPLLCTGMVLDGPVTAAVIARTDQVSQVRDGVRITGRDVVLDQSLIGGSRGTGVLLEDAVGGSVTNNRVRGSAASGIRADTASTGVTIRANDARGNDGMDCVDEQDPSDNDWSRNLGDEAAPAGTCQPA